MGLPVEVGEGLGHGRRPPVEQPPEIPDVPLEDVDSADRPVRRHDRAHSRVALPALELRHPRRHRAVGRHHGKGRLGCVTHQQESPLGHEAGDRVWRVPGQMMEFERHRSEIDHGLLVEHRVGRDEHHVIPRPRLGEPPLAKTCSAHPPRSAPGRPAGPRRRPRRAAVQRSPRCDPNRRGCRRP